METLHSIDDLKSLHNRLVEDTDPKVSTIVIPASTCAQASGANDIVRVAKKEILERKLTEKIQLRMTGCHGFCQMEPNVMIEPRGTFYPVVNMKNMARIVEAVAKDEVLDDLLYTNSNTGKHTEKAADIPFFKKQARTIMGLNEKVDPIRIFNYIQVGGYLSFSNLLKGNNPSAVLSAVKASGLRGRGGAGFPTGSKWEMLAKSKNSHGKILVCNADEGDPGAYMDRAVLEGNPQSIIEGMLIGAFATGANEGVIYVRAEYPLAIKHLIIALRQARELGLLGKNVLGSGFSFDINLVKGAGAFVCGEETALMRSVEGRMGEPRQRPPFPVEKGIDGKPTSINNVETWANIPVIFRMGVEKYKNVGTKNNSGTKIFSLVGKIKNTGLVEVPMGISIREIVDEIGGGQENGTAIKAVQTGGPSGGCIPEEKFELPVDYDSLARVGSIMGSGGMIVMDENTCMVDVAKYFMAFLKDESCGKCYVCRKGTQRMFEILEDITEGKGAREQLDDLEELAQVVKDASMCGLGQTAANPVLSTLRYFYEEYLKHIEQRKCPAGVCKALITFSINDNCNGCGACRLACPESAISGQKKESHILDTAKCIKCGACKSVCKFDAVDVH